MDVHTLEALSDNYMYLIVCRRTKQAACVDPADASTVVAAARRLGATITTVLRASAQRCTDATSRPLALHAEGWRLPAANRSLMGS